MINLHEKYNTSILFLSLLKLSTATNHLLESSAIYHKFTMFSMYQTNNKFINTQKMLIVVYCLFISKLSIVTLTFQRNLHRSIICCFGLLSGPSPQCGQKLSSNNPLFCEETFRMFCCWNSSGCEKSYSIFTLLVEELENSELSGEQVVLATLAPLNKFWETLFNLSLL